MDYKKEQQHGDQQRGYCHPVAWTRVGQEVISETNIMGVESKSLGNWQDLWGYEIRGVEDDVTTERLDDKRNIKSELEKLWEERWV